MDLEFLLPGQYYISKGPILIETLVGSCVSVCLYNITNGHAAMNHFLQDCPKSASNDDIGYYGSTSTMHIIEKLLAHDPVVSHYQAQIFGGAVVIKKQTSENNVGSHNVDIARKILSDYRIRLIHEEVGGTHGRRIRFDTSTNTIYCRFAGQVSKKYRQDWPVVTGEK